MAMCNGLTPSDPRFAELDRTMERFRGHTDAAVCVLGRARQLFGLLPVQVLDYVADGLHCQHSDIYQAVSFYNFFSTRPEGRFPISLCLGTECYLAGTGALFARLQDELGIGPGETTPDGLFSLSVTHFGTDCDGQASFIIDGQRFVASPDEIPAILNEFRRAPALAGVFYEGSD